MSKLVSNLSQVLARIATASEKRSNNFNYFKPRLVAVSKQKSIEEIIECYQNGQRHFGENYIKELEKKAKSTEILNQCPEIKWHFIGTLHSQYVSKLCSLPNLYVIESVYSNQLADKLDKTWATKKRPSPLKCMIQVNTSIEQQKNGISIESVSDFYEYILKNLKNLEVIGLMTIGSLDNSLNSPESENPDFRKLIECRMDIAKKLNIDEKKIELSMGMSNDFEKAILMGSTNVRVGSLIFGERIKKSKI